jgi:hypothetical protein
MWRLRVNQTVAAVLAGTAIILTVFPLPSLPLHYLPAASALALATMYIWIAGKPQETAGAQFDPAHLDEVKKIALDLHQGMGETLDFGVDAVRNRNKLTRHFPQTLKPIKHWEAVHKEWLAAQAAAGERAERVEKSLSLGGAGFWELLQMASWYRATGGGIGSPFGVGFDAHDAAIWAKLPSSDQPVKVALYQDDSERDGKLKRMQATLDATRSWRETRRWNRAQRARSSIHSQLSEAITDVVSHHVLRGHCDYC